MGQLIRMWYERLAMRVFLKDNITSVYMIALNGAVTQLGPGTGYFVLPDSEWTNTSGASLQFQYRTNMAPVPNGATLKIDWEFEVVSGSVSSWQMQRHDGAWKYNTITGKGSMTVDWLNASSSLSRLSFICNCAAGTVIRYKSTAIYYV